jgi:hypothetical protein
MEDQNNESQEELLNPESIEIFTEFALTLKKIHIRLVAEGYTITADGIGPPKERIEVPTSKKKTWLCRFAGLVRNGNIVE